MHTTSHSHSTAQGLASLGRNGDSMLVHMSPSEVHGLQQLALASGGSLTLNPHTGLPEANWLTSLLPTIVGAVLAPFTAGTSLAWMPAVAGAATGALTGPKNMSLLGRMGLGALGGFGGAGIGNAVAGMGAGASAGAGAAGSSALAQGSDILAKTGAQLGTGITAAPAAASATAPAISLAAPAATSLAAPVAASAATPAAEAAATQAAEKGLAQTAYGRMASQSPLTPYVGEKLAGRATMMAALAPTMAEAAQQKAVMTPEEEKPSYYIQGPGGKPLYSQGMVNPHIAQMGYLPSGEAAFIGQGFSPGVYSQSPTQYVPVMATPGKAVTAREGGLMGLKRYAEGGTAVPEAQGRRILATNPAMPSDQPTPGQAALSDMNNYFANQFAQSQQGTPALLPSPPSYSATQDYLAGLNKMVTPSTMGMMQPVAAPSVPPPPDTSAYDALPDAIKQYTNPVMPNYVWDTNTLSWVQSPTQRFSTPHSYREGGLADTYAAGGKLLQGPGDGMSDSIPAVITGSKPQRAALADGEFVVPSDVVSHLGNGSTEAGSRKLYEMMDKVRRARTGSKRQAPAIKSSKYLPS